MMQTTLQLYNWFWWRNRISMLIMIFSVVGAQLYFWLGEPMFSPGIICISIVASCMSALTIFTFGSDLDLTSGRSAFPTWLFNLPIRSLRLACIPVLGMVLAIGWGWLPAAAAIIHIAGERTAQPPSFFGLGVLPWLGICAAGTWLQAIAWWPFQRAWLRLLMLGLLCFMIAAFAVVGSSYHGTWIPTFLIISLAFFGFVAAVVSASKARYLNWRSESNVDSSARPIRGSDVSEFAPRLSDIQGKSFASFYSALAWRDWVQLGKGPFVLMLLIGIPMLFLVLSRPLSISILFLFFVPPILMLMVSPLLGKSKYWKGEYRMTAYLAGLPVSDSQFVNARFGNTLRAALAMWTVSLMVALVWLVSYPANREQFFQVIQWCAENYDLSSGWLAVAAFLLVSFYLTVVAPWAGLALGLVGRNWLVNTVMVSMGLVGLIAFFSSMHFFNQMIVSWQQPELRAAFFQSFVVDLKYWMNVLIAAKILISTGLIIFAYRGGYLNAVAITRYGAISLVGFAIAACAFLVVLMPFGLTVKDILLGVFLTFPLGALVASRITNDWNRHR